MATYRALTRLQTISKHLGLLHSTGVHAISRNAFMFPTTARSLASYSTSQAAADWWGKCRRIKVLDGEMSYYDSDPEGKHQHAVVFLHGNPTSSFLWRNVIPHVEPAARCLAPDLIGQGRSSKRANHSYRFVDHYQYLSEWFDSVELPDKVNLVIHDWGSALGFHWSHMHPDRVDSITHMEGIVAPVPGWEAFPDIARNIFQAMRSESGEEMVLQKNFFVERLLPGAIMRELSEDEMNAYREPFAKSGEDRRPTLTWPREIPVEGDGPDDVVKIVKDYFNYFREAKHIPMLYIDGDPGFFSSHLRKLMDIWPNQQMVKVKGLHFLQEDSPKEIGEAVRDFLTKTVYKK